MPPSNDAARRDQQERDFWQCVSMIIDTVKENFPEADILTNHRLHHVTISFPEEIPLASPAPPDPEPEPESGSEPPPPLSCSTSPVGCPRDILDILCKADRRMTAEEIMAEVSSRSLGWSDSKIRNTLVTLVDMGVLDNETRLNPRGYYLCDDN